MEEHMHTKQHFRRGGATTGLIVGVTVAAIALGSAAWMLSGVESAATTLGPAFTTPPSFPALADFATTHAPLHLL